MKDTPPTFYTFSIKDVLSLASRLLREVSDSPALDAELLLAYCMEKERAFLFTWPEKELTKKQLACFQRQLEKRQNDYPVAYCLGHKEFWTLDLIVTPDVLIPRPETELLVEIALEKITAIKNPKILDLGTGSGAIALALAAERPDATITATDFSVKALKIAQKNAKKHDLDKQVRFIQSNWFANITETEFDLIVSNPPYIASDDPHLLKTIRHEPQQALVAKTNGMKAIETIIKKSQPYLKKQGWLILEHGYNQAEQTQQLLLNHGYKHPESHQDINGNLRVSTACK